MSLPSECSLKIPFEYSPENSHKITPCFQMRPLSEMSYTNLVAASILLAMVIPSAGMFFGGGGGGCGGGGGGCGGGCGRKKR